MFGSIQDMQSQGLQMPPSLHTLPHSLPAQMLPGHVVGILQDAETWSWGPSRRLADEVQKVLERKHVLTLAAWAWWKKCDEVWLRHVAASSNCPGGTYP